MVTVPRASSQVRNQQSNLPYQSGRGASAAAFGALTGQALSSLGNDINQLGQMAAERVVEANVENIRRYSKDLDTEYSMYQNELLYGDGTADNPGFMSLQGENSVQALPEVQRKLAEKRAELLGRTGENQRIKDLFNQSADQRDEDFGRMTFNRVAQQRQAANKASSEARVASALNDAALNWQDTGIFERSALIIDDEVRDQARQLGLSEEAAAEMVRQYHADMVDKVVTSALQFDYKQARNIYEKYAANLDGVTKAALNQKIDAKHRQIIADMEAQERDSDADRVRRQKLTKDALTAKFALGDLTELDLTNAITSGNLDSDQYQDLLGLLRNPPGDTDLNVDEEMRVQIAIHQRQITDPSEIANNKVLGGRAKQRLLNTFFTEADQGGTLNRYDVKAGRDFVDSYVGGVRGPLAVLDTDASQRVARAMEYYNSAILKTPPGQLNAEAIDRIKKETIAVFGPTGLGSPAANLQALPRPSTWAGPQVGPKVQLDMLYGIAVDTLTAKVEAGEMSEEQAIQELDLLEKYRQNINMME